MNNTTNQNNQSECDDLRDLLPAYMIGATTAEEARRVEDLLPLCPEVRGDMQEYAALAHGLATTVEPQQPAPGVKTALMAKLATQESQAADSSRQTQENLSVLSEPPSAADAKRKTRETTEIRTQKDRRTPAWWLLAAACLALVASNVYWLTQVRDMQSELRLLRQQQTDMVTALASTRGDAVPLQSSTGDEVLATVLWNPNANQATLTTNTLPPLDDTQTYQLWLIDDTGASSAGLFKTDVTGSEVYTFDVRESLSAYSAIGISIEPAAGSEVPTTDPIAVGTIRQ